MTKKILLVLALLLFAGTMAGYSWGVGAAFGWEPVGGLPGTNVMFSFKAPQTPFLWGVGFLIDENNFTFGLTADYWMVQENLVSFINLYIGPGLYFGANNNNVSIGGRLPIGINMFPIDNLEFFLEAAPTLALGLDPIDFPQFGVQGAFGLRFWF